MNKKLIAAAVSGALVAPMAAQAVDFKTSGHINRMIRFADNGQGSDVQFTGNTSSRSRVRFVGSSDIGNGMKAGVNLEIGLDSNRSGVGAGTDIKGADAGDSVGDIRHSALWFSGTWGKVHLGHTSGAADGMTGADLRGTWAADPQTSYSACGGCNLRLGSGGNFNYVENADGDTAQLNLNQFHSTFDGGRLDVLRYDSPKLGPAQIRVSVANNEQWEVGGYVNTDVGGGALALSAGYISSGNRSGWDRFGISGSFKFSQGTAIKVGYSEQDAEDDPTWLSDPLDADDLFVSLGHTWGANSVSISYGTTDWGNGTDSEGTRWGIGWQHEISKPGVTIYAGYHNFDHDTPAGIDIEDFDIFRVGTLVRFK